MKSAKILALLYQVSESLTPAAHSRIGIYLIHHGKQHFERFAMSTLAKRCRPIASRLKFWTR